MFRRLRNPIRVRLDDQQALLDVEYTPSGKKPLFDICDAEGRIIKSGHFNPGLTSIEVQDLINSVYVFLILDGDRIRARRFEIHRPAP